MNHINSFINEETDEVDDGSDEGGELDEEEIDDGTEEKDNY